MYLYHIPSRDHPWSVGSTTLLGKTMHLHLVCIVESRCNYAAPHSSCPISEPYIQSERVTLHQMYNRIQYNMKKHVKMGQKVEMWQKKCVWQRLFNLSELFSNGETDGFMVLHIRAYKTLSNITSLYKMGLQTSNLWSTHKQLHHLATELNAWWVLQNIRM